MTILTRCATLVGLGGPAAETGTKRSPNVTGSCIVAKKKTGSPDGKRPKAAEAAADEAAKAEAAPAEVKPAAKSGRKSSPAPRTRKTGAADQPAKKGPAKTRSRRSTATAKTDSQPVKPAKPPTSVKTKMPRKELEQYRQLLLIKRNELLGDVVSMSNEALHGDDADLSHMPIHMADVGSDQFEKELTLGLVESERAMLQEIDEALQRIDDRTYGICQATGKPIAKARLKIKPWAKYTVEATREMERNGQR